MSESSEMRNKVVIAWVEKGLAVKEIAEKYNLSVDKVLIYLGEFDTGPAREVDDPALLDNDPVNHPSHYTKHPSGIECIEITRHMNFNLGNAVKYIWRAGGKDVTKEVEDLEKAIWYLKDEIVRITREYYTGPVVSTQKKDSGSDD